MPYTLFHEKFPEIAKKETRSFASFDKSELAGSEFGLLEMYCDEPDCDCRRVMFCVMSRQHEKPMAYIAYGWEDDQFYIDWFRNNDPDIIRELKGPVLNTMSPQSKLAPALLEVVTGLLQDQAYVNRLKRHYNMFRATIEKKTSKFGKRSYRATKRKPKKRRR